MQRLAQLAIEGDFDQVRQLATDHLVKERDEAGRTVLMLAADADWTPQPFSKCIEYFLHLGADAKAADLAFNTAAHVAAGRNHLRMLALLPFEAKWLANKEGVTPLMEAAHKGSWQCAKHLLHLFRQFRYQKKKSELLGWRCSHGHTALEIARASGQTDLATVIELEMRLVVSGEEASPLQWRIQGLSTAEAEAQQELMQMVKNCDFDGLKRAANPLICDLPDTGGLTPLMRAAWCDSVEAVQLLLELGADATCTGVDGRSCLHWAAEGGRAGSAEHLLAAGAPANARADPDYLGGRTPLMLTVASLFAIPKIANETCRVLLSAGADWSLRDKWCHAPLDFATNETDLFDLLHEWNKTSFFDKPMANTEAENAKVALRTTGKEDEKCRGWNETLNRELREPGDEKHWSRSQELFFDMIAPPQTAFGEKINISEGKMQLNYFRCPPETSRLQERCEMLLQRIRSDLTKAGSGFEWISMELSTVINIKDSELSIGEGTKKALNIVLKDLCRFVGLFSPNDQVEIVCDRTLINDLFLSDLTTQNRLPFDLIKLLCGLVLGFTLFKVGKASLIVCIGGSDHFTFTIQDVKSNNSAPAGWILFDPSDKEFNQSLKQRIAKLEEHNSSYIFILFDELKVNLQKQVSSSMYLSSGPCKMTLRFHDSQIDMQIVTFDRNFDGHYAATTGIESIKNIIKQDAILSGAVDGMSNVKLNCSITFVTIPCRSSIWYYTSYVRRTQKVTEDKFIQELCQLAADGNFEELIKCSASIVNKSCPKYLNRTPFHSAAAAATFRPYGSSTEGHTNCAIALIFCGADASIMDKLELSVLHSAVNSMNISLLEFLLCIRYINCNCKSGDGWTPLMIAAKSNNVEAAELLMKAGAVASLENDDGETAEMICDIMKNTKVKEKIIEMLQAVQNQQA